MQARHIATSYALRAAEIVHPKMSEKEYDRVKSMDDHAAVWNRVAKCIKLDAQALIDAGDGQEAGV